MNFSQITSKFSPKGWLMIGGSAAAVLVFGMLLISMASAPSYTTLMAGVDPAQTGKITSALSTAGIPYQIQNNGTAIAVQSDKEAQARVSLATSGLLTGAAGSNPLSQVANGSTLGQSNFQQQTAYTGALEQQLDQEIGSIQGVSSAQVSLVLPNPTNQLFSNQSSQASAAVLLSDSGTLAGGSVKGIADLVANSVQGLTDSKVTITDQTGQLLWPNGSAAGSLLSKESAQNAYDAQMAAQANAMLVQALGPGKSEVQVNADVNANQTTLDSLTYSGKAVPLTVNASSETLKGTGGSSGGVAGTTTNTKIPSYSATGNGNSNYVNKSSQTTYGVNKTVSHTQVAPGQVNRQSVSVLFDKSVPVAEQKSLEAAVASTVGINSTRGDTISYGSVNFQKLPVAPTASSTTKMVGYAKYGIVGLGAMLFLFFMSRMLRRRENEAFAGNPTWLRELESPRSLASLEAETQQLDSPTRVMQLRSPVNVAKQQVEDLVARDPDRVASQVRQWMSED